MSAQQTRLAGLPLGGIAKADSDGDKMTKRDDRRQATGDSIGSLGAR